MITFDRVTKRFDERLVLDELDLIVRPGEVFGFLGPNGAGKTTGLRILVGLLRPDSGRASVSGYDIERQAIQAKRRLGYVPESPKLYDSMSAYNFLDLVSALHHLPPTTAKASRDSLLELFGLAESRHEPLRTLSKGMRQKVVIAAALVHRPEVLILDEPLDGLDPNAVSVMKAVLTQLASEGKSVLISSHSLDLIERLCSRICILNNGKKMIEGTPQDICIAVGSASLGDAFGKLTDTRDPRAVADQILSAL